MQGTHPTTAKKGNLIAAGGMAIAVITTLLLDGMGNWGVIIGGLARRLGDRRDRLAARADDRDAADGGALQRRRRRRRRADRLVGVPPRRAFDPPLDEFIPVLFAAVIGSVSFWGSNIAFAKLQDLIPTKPIAVPGQQVINALLLIGIARGVRDPRLLRRSLAGVVHRRPRRRRDPRQPRRAADRRRRHAGRDLAAERVHRTLRRRRRLRARQRRADRRRHARGLLGNAR